MLNQIAQTLRAVTNGSRRFYILRTRQGESGSVTSFEGSSQRVDIVAETVQLNQVDNIVDVRHAVVATNVGVFLDIGDAETVSPGELPKCDVLVSDCEGTELEILSDLTQKPNTIIVETHGNNGSPTVEVKSLLEDNGYNVVSSVPENRQKDVFVLIATLIE